MAVDAMQCGYCTAGMIMSGVGLLKKTPNPTDAEILRAMEGNICRCGTYHRIVAAIRQAAGGDKAAKGGAL
jgi:isoquinoline 1-oxidoreductase alpha subunit